MPDDSEVTGHSIAVVGSANAVIGKRSSKLNNLHDSESLKRTELQPQPRTLKKTESDNATRSFEL